MYRNQLKRFLDFTVAFCAFTLALPIFLVVVIGLAFVNHGKVFFLQVRPGKNGKLFRTIKFRTMNDRKDASGQLLPDAARLTLVGKLVRKTSLDEIPQLINIMKGDMSLIGPRPLLVDYLPRYNETQKRRHEVRPGITGWAQVNGRNAISWEQKFKYDVWYIDHVSFALDLKIMLLTIKKVFRSEGISQQGHATMPSFEGIKQT